MTENLDTLSDRELETLRLLGRGHEAKSIASALGVSIHTVNERLRAARRKLGVSSSREAARLLLAQEARSKASKNSGYKKIGVEIASADQSSLRHAHSGAAGARRRATWIMLGGPMLIVLMSVLVATQAAHDPMAISPEPVSPIQSLFAASDYPPEAAARKVQGITDYRVQVGTNGRVEKCDVERSSGSAALDQATCRVITKRARFRPAMDAAGHPQTSIYMGFIHWMLEQ